MNIKAFAADHISAYKIKVGKYNVMLDFNGDNLTKEDVDDVDFIFLSHEHLDHCEKLINYEIVDSLKRGVKIFTTKTTKKIVSYSLTTRMNDIRHVDDYSDKIYNQIKNLLDNIVTVPFKKEIIIDDNFSFTFYRSGHTFGSSMVYIKSSDYSLLYTGDMDYADKDENRKYDFPYNMKVDYIICDGTNLFNKDYKGVYNRFVKNKLSERKPGDIVLYKARTEKAVLYALSLASKIDNCLFLYTDKLKWYIKILYEQQYDIFKTDKVMMEREYEERKELYKDKIIVKFSDGDKGFDVNTDLSLHITKIDFSNFLETYFVEEPKKVFVGHYNFKEHNPNELEIENAVILNVGDNDV